MMIDIDGKLINSDYVVSADVKTIHYMNGSVSQLIVKMSDGTRIVKEHGFGFNAFDVLEKIKRASS